MSVEKIIAVESGGNNFARNPHSSAFGPGQFLSSTWMNMIQKYRPDLAQSMSQDAVLNLRSDPILSRAMTEAYANENAQRLVSAGFQDTPGNRYLAHFAGPAGAQSLLEAPQGASAEAILGSQVVAANPFLRGMTAQDVINWAGNKMSGGSAQPSPSSAQAQAFPQASNIKPDMTGLPLATPEAPKTEDDSTARELDALKQQLAAAQQSVVKQQPAIELKPMQRRAAQFDLETFKSLLKRRG